MADRRPGTALVPRVISTPAHLLRQELERQALTASVRPLSTYNQMALTITPSEPQREAWAFYHSLGEVNFAIGTWLANSVSRCRLFAAKKSLGSDDPEPIDDGPFAQLVSRLGGGMQGQATMLKRMAVQLSVPGESFVVTEESMEFPNVWSSEAYSNTELRITGRTPLTYQINSQRNIWRPLNPSSLVSRVWWPDDEIKWIAASPCQAGLPIMREIDMYNRYIIATLLSRVVNNGIFFIPSEATFPAKPQYKDAADPFVEEWVDAATRAIKNPGTAAAALPMPLKVKAEMIEKFRHMTFATEMDQKVVEAREKSLIRLANTLNIPAEVLTGMGDMNHWGAWKLEEAGVKTHISPVVEVIVNGLTDSYLKPMAAAAGLSTVQDDGSEIIIWYDASALVEQPDRSTQANDAYDRGLINDDAYRTATGFDDTDAPSEDELKDMVLKKISMGGGADSMAALSVLVGDPSIAEVPQRVTDTGTAPPPPDEAQTGGPGQPTQAPSGPSGVQQGPPASQPGNNLTPPASTPPAQPQPRR